MLTKNFTAITALNLARNSVNIPATTLTGEKKNINYTMIAGTSSYSKMFEHSMAAPRIFDPIIKGETDACCGVYFGSGNTPPTTDDSFLETVITSGLTVTTGNYSNIRVSSYGDGFEFSSVYSVYNTSSDPITIRETCLCLCLTTGSSAVGKEYCHMVDRTVLDTPVMIEPLHVKYIKYAIRIPFPTA